jgi:hypothetical protein
MNLTHRFPSCAAVQNSLIRTSTLPYACITSCAIRPRDNCTFTSNNMNMAFVWTSEMQMTLAPCNVVPWSWIWKEICKKRASVIKADHVRCIRYVKYVASVTYNLYFIIYDLYAEDGKYNKTPLIWLIWDQTGAELSNIPHYKMVPILTWSPNR